MRNKSAHRRAFTLIELIAVIVVLAILSGVAIPKYFDYAADAKESSCKGTLGGVRAAIANFYANSAINGTPAYPTINQLRTAGTVMQEPIPENPYNNTDRADQIRVRNYDPADPFVGGDRGWNYDPNKGKFWANSDTNGIDENEF